MQIEPLAVPVDDGCKIIGIKRSKFYQLIREGEIEVVRIGGRTLAVVDSLRACVERARGKAA